MWGKTKITDTCLRVVMSTIIDQHLVESDDTDNSLKRWKSQTSWEWHHLPWIQERKHHRLPNMTIAEAGIWIIKVWPEAMTCFRGGGLRGMLTSVDQIKTASFTLPALGCNAGHLKRNTYLSSHEFWSGGCRWVFVGMLRNKTKT